MSYHLIENEQEQKPSHIKVWWFSLYPDSFFVSDIVKHSLVFFHLTIGEEERKMRLHVCSEKRRSHPETFLRLSEPVFACCGTAHFSQCHQANGTDQTCMIV